MNKLITSAEAAKILGISISKCTALIRQGRIMARPHPKGLMQYAVMYTDVIEYKKKFDEAREFLGLKPK